MAITEKDRVKKIIVEILNRHAVRKAALFSSIVRDEQSPESDIDLLMEFTPGKSLLDLVGLKLELEDILNRKLDVVTYKSLHPLLKNRILAKQEVILG